jgi:hypothetical protein
MLVYICASLLHLAVDSRSLSQAEKKVTAAKPEQIHKMTNFLSENNCHFVKLLSFASSYFFLSLKSKLVIKQPTAKS